MSSAEVVNATHNIPREEIAFRKYFAIFVKHASFSDPSIQTAVRRNGEAMWRAEISTKVAYDNVIMIITENKAWRECPTKFQKMCSKYLDWQEHDKGDYKELHRAERRHKAEKRRAELRGEGVHDGQHAVTGGGWTRVERPIPTGQESSADASAAVTQVAGVDSSTGPALPAPLTANSTQPPNRADNTGPLAGANEVGVQLTTGHDEDGACSVKTSDVENNASSSSLDPQAAEFTPMHQPVPVKEAHYSETGDVQEPPLAKDALECLAEAMDVVAIQDPPRSADPAENNNQAGKQVVGEIPNDDEDSDWILVDEDDGWDMVDGDDIIPADLVSDGQQPPARGWFARFWNGRS